MNRNHHIPIEYTDDWDNRNLHRRTESQISKRTFCADGIYNEQEWAAYFTSDCEIGGSFFYDGETLQCKSPPSFLVLKLSESEVRYLLM